MMYLAWDSQFFGKKIGKIEITTDFKDLETKLQKAFEENYDLVYAFGEKNTQIPHEILENFKGKLVDKKIIYTAPPKGLQTKNTVEIKEFFKKNGHLLYDLAYLSGTHSRFRLDTGLGIENFKRLYQEWIDKSVSHQIAKKVFVYQDEEQIKGMVTLGVKENTATIGLIAVNENLQGKGIGISLIDACVRYCINENIVTLNVPTQLDNIQACGFYKKCGFTEKTVQNIYHFWA